MAHKRNFNFQPRISDVQTFPKRSTAPVYKGEIVLSTDFLQNSKTQKFNDNLNKIVANFPDHTFIHFEMEGEEPHKLVYSVTNTLYALNRSRPLRRAKVSGIRACCLNHLHKNWKYICDLGFTSFFGASVVASGLLQYFTPNDCEIIFKGSKRVAGNRRAILHNLHVDYSTRFYAETGLTKNTVHLLNVSEDTMGIGLPTLVWRVSSERMDLFDLVYSIVEVFGFEVEEIRFKKWHTSMIISRDNIFNPDKYVERPFDKALLGFRFRRFSTFGRFHNDSEYMVY